MIKPMLAKEFDPKIVKKWSGIYLNKKFDGLRCIYSEGQFWSRTGKSIISLPKLLEEVKELAREIPLDGELYSFTDGFRKIISSARRTVNIQENENICYVVYDTPQGGNFTHRYQIIQNLLKEYKGRVILCDAPYISVPVNPRLEDLNPYVKDGFEGTMLRNPNGLYRFGRRSSDLLKVKFFMEQEFECIGATPKSSFEKIILDKAEPGSHIYSDGRHYRNGSETILETLGSLVCKTAAGTSFEVGSGYDDATRLYLWNNIPFGKMITVKYQEMTDHDPKLGVPRFPIFKCIRDYE